MTLVLPKYNQIYQNKGITVKVLWLQETEPNISTHYFSTIITFLIDVLIFSVVIEGRLQRSIVWFF